MGGAFPPPDEEQARRAAMSHGPANWIRDTADLAKADAAASGSRSPPDPHFLPPPNLRKSQGWNSIA